MATTETVARSFFISFAFLLRKDNRSLRDLTHVPMTPDAVRSGGKAHSRTQSRRSSVVVHIVLVREIASYSCQNHTESIFDLVAVHLKPPSCRTDNLTIFL